MNIFEFRDSRRIITYRRNIEVSDAEELGVPVVHDGGLVAYYLEEGFYVVSVPMVGVTEFSNRYLWFVVNSLVCLNEDAPVDDLVDFMYLYMMEFSSVRGYEPNKVYLRDLIDSCIEGLDEQRCYQFRKFFFVNKLDKNTTKSVVMSYLNKRNKSEMVKNIDNVIQWLCIEGNKFITAQSIRDGLEDDVSLSTVRRYMEVFKDEIDSHNNRVFGTSNFITYKKTLSIHKIKGAIQILNDANERLSRRKVAKEAGVHFNTVQNLWDDEDIQSELDKYNSVA